MGGNDGLKRKLIAVHVAATKSTVGALGAVKELSEGGFNNCHRGNTSERFN